MKFVAQHLEEILASLRPLTVEWKDETASRVIERLRLWPVKPKYTAADLEGLLDENFEDGLLVCRLFLGLSKDEFLAGLRQLRGGQGIGLTAYRSDRRAFVEALLNTNILQKMSEETNRERHWSDVLVERLRSGRGSAIAGQKRGRSVEDFVETIVRKIFSKDFQLRCSFTGPRGQIAKCDIAVPTKTAPRILIEAKGYGATGSKMTDVLGDLRGIIAVKRPDTALLFFTDGLTWKQRQGDLRKIVEFQNEGSITRIYTYAMASQFERDLRTLKREYGL